MDKISKYGFGIGIAAVVLYVLPYILLGQDAYVTIHDNLDSSFTYFRVLAQNGQMFSTGSVIEQVMNGLGRNCFPGSMRVLGWLFLLFEPYTVYVVNLLVLRIVAFSGMYLLLKSHFLKNEGDGLVVFGSSLCFGLLPFYAVHGLSIAGQPLLLYAFLNLLYRKPRAADFLIIFAFPFYSSLIATGVFVIFCMGVLFIYDWFRNGVNAVFLAGLMTLTVVSAITEHALISMMFLGKGFVSHRAGWDITYLSNDLMETVKASAENLILGQYHTASLHTVILVLAVIVIVSCFVRKTIFSDGNCKLLVVLFVLAFLISMFYGFYKWAGLVPLKEQFGVLKMFNFRRFHWLHPTLWYLIFALSLSIAGKWKHGRKAVVGLIIFQVCYCVAGSAETRANARIIGSKIASTKSTDISFGGFFSEGLFDEIDRAIDRPKSDYRIVSIGMHPSIAQYNGFYTLDSYQSNYPIEYKEKFRQIIEGELAKSEYWRGYFDSWGSRCYVFAAELEEERFVITKVQGVKVSDLTLNTEALKAMGGEYIFSAVEIMNAEENGLALVGVFERDDSPWRIYLYRVDGHAETGTKSESG